MADESRTIELNIPLKLKDYLSLQIWSYWRGWRWIPIFMPFVLFTISIVGSLLNGWRPLVALRIAERGWVFDLFFSLIFLPLMAIVLLGLKTVQWQRGALPLELRASINESNVTVRGQFDYVAHWVNATSARQNSTAYFLRFKNLLIRFPKRGFTSEQKHTFEELVAVNVSPELNRIK